MVSSCTHSSRFSLSRWCELAPFLHFETNQKSSNSSLTFHIAKITSQPSGRAKRDAQSLQQLGTTHARQEDGASPSKSALQRAREWQAMMNVPGATSRAELAIKLGVSRARVTQVLCVLDAPRCVLTALERVERSGVVITTRKWLDLKGMPIKKLISTLEALSNSMPACQHIAPEDTRAED